MSQVVAVQVCTTFSNNSDGSMYCSSSQWQQAYLIPPDAAGYVDLVISGGFDGQSFAIGFGGVITAFVTGLTLGWIASVLRKLK